MKIRPSVCTVGHLFQIKPIYTLEPHTDRHQQQQWCSQIRFEEQRYTHRSLVHLTCIRTIAIKASVKFGGRC